jgi:hypothetical protein
MEFSGRLATIQFGDVLQLAHQERWSGALVVRRTSREKRIFLHHGRVVGCLSDDPAEYLGRHLLLRGALTEKDLARALAWCSEHGRRLGEALSELELLSEDEVRASLASRIASSCGTAASSTSRTTCRRRTRSRPLRSTSSAW